MKYCFNLVLGSGLENHVITFFTAKGFIELTEQILESILYIVNHTFEAFTRQRTHCSSQSPQVRIGAGPCVRLQTTQEMCDAVFDTQGHGSMGEQFRSHLALESNGDEV